MKDLPESTAIAAKCFEPRPPDVRWHSPSAALLDPTNVLLWSEVYEDERESVTRKVSLGKLFQTVVAARDASPARGFIEMRLAGIAQRYQASSAHRTGSRH